MLRRPSTNSCQPAYKVDRARKILERLRFDLVSQPARLAVGRNEVIPAPRHHRAGRELQHAVRQRIALVMIEEQPAVQPFFAQRRLNFCQSHGLYFMCQSAASSPSS